MALSEYLADTMNLLHDQSFQFSSQVQMIRWINSARTQVAKRTGCIRRLITGQSAFGANTQPGTLIPGAGQPGMLPGAFPYTGPLPITGPFFPPATNALMTIPGVERYPFQGFFNPFVQQEYGGVKGILDVISLSVNWGGTLRPTLYWKPWDELQAYARAYATLVTSFPYYWSVYDDGENGEVWMFPAPSTAGEIEADSFCVPNNIYSDDDVDAIPETFRDAIKYKAAMNAYLGSQRYQQAAIMEAEYEERIGIDRVASDRGKVPNYYYSVP